MLSASPPCSVRRELLAQLKGKELRIPDLSLMLEHWPSGVNPEIEGVRASVPGRISSITDSAKKQKLLAKIDSGLFSSAWWPDATVEAGDILSCLTLWLFVWDDEIDAEVGDLAQDVGAAQEFREETINYVRHCLGLAENGVPCEVPSNQIIAFFKVIGDAACEAYDIEHRKILLKELEFFMETSEAEQRRRLSPELPSMEEYMETRLGTSAVNVMTFFNEFANELSVPVEVLGDPDMKIIWDASNIIIWAMNDLLSLKKEVAQDAVDSLVPLLYHKVGDLDLAVSMVLETIEKAVRDFDAAADVLENKFLGNAEVVDDLRSYIDACRLNCTGNLNWSLQTGRYGVSQHAIAGGVVLCLA